MKYHSLASFLLRVGLASTLLYAAVASELSPEKWAEWFPAFIAESPYIGSALTIHALAEVALALWLLSGRLVFWAAAITSLAMLSIVFFNLNALDIVFRDVAIMFMGLALMAMHTGEVKLKH